MIEAARGIVQWLPITSGKILCRRNCNHYWNSARKRSKIPEFFSYLYERGKCPEVSYYFRDDRKGNGRRRGCAILEESMRFSMDLTMEQEREIEICISTHANGRLNNPVPSTIVAMIWKLRKKGTNDHGQKSNRNYGEACAGVSWGIVARLPLGFRYMVCLRVVRIKFLRMKKLCVAENDARGVDAIQVMLDAA